MQITGKITNITPIQIVGTKQQEKCIVVIEETDSEYPSSMAIDVFWQKVQFIKNYKLGDIVTAKFNGKVREYNDKIYNGISLWRIDAADPTGTQKYDKNWTDEDLPF